MTSLAVSLSVDARGPCALYIITDSRTTWGNSTHHWDSGQKTFASRRFPDVFGYCGDAFFPPMTPRQTIEQLDVGLVCSDGAKAEERQGAFFRILEVAMKTVTGSPPILPFVVYHGAREGQGLTASFRLWQMHYTGPPANWSTVECAIAAEHSYLVQLDGSGGKFISSREAEWKKSSVGGTSRSAIWAFCEALRSGKDPFSGGSPQLVGLWRIGAGRNFGFLWNGKPYLAGLEVVGNIKTETVHWFNHLFERCDASTGSRLKFAQKHVKPKFNSCF
jgi:hypothetical protein